VKNQHLENVFNPQKVSSKHPVFFRCFFLCFPEQRKNFESEERFVEISAAIWEETMKILDTPVEV